MQPALYRTAYVDEAFPIPSLHKNTMHNSQTRHVYFTNSAKQSDYRINPSLRTSAETPHSLGTTAQKRDDVSNHVSILILFRRSNYLLTFTRTVDLGFAYVPSYCTLTRDNRWFNLIAD